MAAALLAGGFAPGFEAKQASAESHVDNPFVGASAYVNPDYAKFVDTSIAQVSDETLKAKMQTVKSYPTAIWLDRIAAIAGGSANGGRKSLRETMDDVLAQKQGDTPITATFVIYDIPGRDCHALASNGELAMTPEALQTYKTSYIDEIAKVFKDPKYAGIRIVNVIEPDSLPNLVTNLNDPKCAQANSTNVYRDGVRYALDVFHAIPNVYNYLDIGHSGWLGWDSNRQPAIELYTSVVSGTKAGLSSVDGFVTNTANTSPLEEPYLSDPNLNIGGQQIKSAKYYEWNPYFDETDFAAAMYNGFLSKGWPAGIGFIIDTSRNGWGGSNRPTGASGYDVNTYVNSGRIDRKLHRGNWCNQSGAGMGRPPQAAPAEYAAAHLDALAWIKPPGDSDGASSYIPNDEGKGFDRMCDPTYFTADGTLTGSLPNAPLSGHWFHNQFVELVQNAYPAIPLSTGTGGNNGGGNNGGGTGPVVPAPTAPAAPTGVKAQITISWTASANAASYKVKRATDAAGPFTTVATGLTGTSYTDSAVSSGVTYYYAVTAVNSAGESPNSALISAAVQPVSTTPTTPTPTVPSAPSGVSASAADAQVKLVWNTVSGASSYTVKRSASASGPFTAIASGLTGSSYTDSGLTNGSTYYYVVTAVNSAGESTAPSAVSAKPQASGTGTGTGTPPASGSLTVQYRAGDTNAADNQIKPLFNIKNTGGSAVPLSELTLRYYFSKDGSPSMNSWIDWAQIGGSNINRTFTDTYVELSFTSGAGSIQAGGQTGDIMLRMSKNDWSNFNESNDYSFDASKTSYTDWSKVTLYRNGTLVWGQEP
ncbi:glycoside hydrolase family 6 protein [Gorillibacterium sp. sgz5001074]|uniref:glycoside hydrolase family 6 protein n=1 Tax=Gorillibacterium sp. sgz5001074 TaxID=3446695 RepID=UPI003F66C69D